MSKAQIIVCLSSSSFNTQFIAKAGNKSLTCKEEGCKTQVIAVLSSLTREYEDINAKDQVARIQQNVDNVRNQMQINLAQGNEEEGEEVRCCIDERHLVG